MRQERIIENKIKVDIKEIISYHELMFFFAWKDIKVRYKRTFLGAIWAIAQPFITMVVFTIFFGKVAKVPSYDLPYPLFYYSALLPWNYFASSFQSASQSVSRYSAIVSKVYLPRIILPISSVIPPLVDFSMAFLMLGLLMLIYGVPPRPTIVLFPLFIFVLLLVAVTLGIWLSTIASMYQDINYVMPFFVSLLLFSSPVIYPAGMVPEEWRTIYQLNPISIAIEGFRWCIFGVGIPPEPKNLIISLAMVSVALFGGIIFFFRMEKKFLDMI